MKALIIDQVSSHIREYLLKNGVEVDEFFLPTHDELVSMIGQYDLLVMRVDPKIDRAVLDAATRLKAITLAAAGMNHIDLAYAAEKGIIVTNASGGNSNAVAEMTFCKILEMARHAIAANNELKNEHRWNKYKWLGFELRGKTIGIIGYGRIGQRVGQLARAFGMDVIACDPLYDEEQMAAMGARKASLEELLKAARVISIHTPLDESTVNLISTKEFDLMRPDALVLNMARGGILDEQAALVALQEKKVAAISVDVLKSELGESSAKGETIVDSPLFAFDSFTISPHIAGGGTVDSLDALGEIVIENISRIFSLPPKPSAC